MHTITISILDKTDYITATPFIFTSQQTRLLNEGLLYGAYCDDILCGVLGAVENDSTLTILSLYVQEDYRRLGIGSRLLSEAKSFAQSHGLSQIYISYSCQAKERFDLMTFFTKNGYPFPTAGETVYSLPLSSLTESYFYGIPDASEKASENIYTLRSIPTAKWQEYIANSTVPAFLLPESALGKIVEDLSLVYIHKGKLTALLIITDTDGEFYLNSAFIDSQMHGAHLIYLLKQAYRTMLKKYNYYQTLSITGATTSGSNLIKELLAGADITEYTAYTVSLPVPHPLQLVPNGYEGVLIRFQTLTDVLRAREIDSSLVMIPGRFPYMELNIKGTQEPLGLHYEVISTETDDYAGFRMITELKLPTETMEPASIEAFRSEIEETTSYFTILTDKQELLLRRILEEGSSFDEELLVDHFLLPLIKDCEGFVARLSS